MLHLDFEFNEVVEKQVNLVCCTTTLTENTKVLEVKEWWLHFNPEAQYKLKMYLEKHKEEIVFGYSTVAEARSYMALGLDPVEFNWIDGFLEYRMLTNHNDDLLYGEQLVNGKIKLTRKPPPKWQRTEEDSLGSFKPTHSLSEATFKLVGEVRDTEHKNKMRDIIISGDRELIEKNKTHIQKYCTTDTVFLPQILEAIKQELSELGFSYSEIEKEMLLRGKYSALTAHMESRGYPINYFKTMNFSKAVAPLLEECQRQINATFPSIRPFKYNRSQGRFSLDQNTVQKWIVENADTDRWKKTDGWKKAVKSAIEDFKSELAKTTKRKITQSEKAEVTARVPVNKYLSLSLEAWTNQFDFKHSYPAQNFGAQMVRYLKLKQNLNGFTPNLKTGSFWDSVGSDGRVRPYFNHFGSLTGRSQPSSKSFLHLKPAWMRSLCEPEKGRVVGSIDYGSQEYFISALISEDDDMIDSYLSEDVYMAFAILSGMAPEGATKATHPEERQLAKATVLAMSYLMTAVGLANKLTLDTGVEVTEDEAQDYIDTFYEVFPRFKHWQENIQEIYANDRYLKLPCGWTLFGDNDNFRSVVNFSIQGMGGSILRKAVEFCHEEGLEVILTLHDAIYIEFDYEDWGAMDKLRDCMVRAFKFYFPEEQKELASKIKVDPYVWGPDLEKDSSITTPKGWKIDCSDIYIDERSVGEYSQFSKYFEDRAENYL